jgi:hypothetical protein
MQANGAKPATKAQRVRTKPYVAAVVDRYRANDANGTYFYNAKEVYGGIRPDTVADYYKAPFGFDNDSLQPWKGLDDDGNKVITGLVHDDLGQDMEQLFPDRVGRAGVYLRPSNIGGDSYRFRAQVDFRQLKGAWMFPNHEVLDKRYQVRPQAHTCGLRMWRRTSVRAYTNWGAAAPGWARCEPGNRDYYRQAWVLFDPEGGDRDSLAIDFDALLSETKPLEVAEYKKVVSDFCVKLPYKDQSKITLSNSYIWPWTTAAKNFGIFESPDNIDVGTYETVFLSGVWKDTWDKFCEPLLYLLVKKSEEKTGRLRGHFLAEMNPSPKYRKQIYGCNSCAKPQIVLEAETTEGTANGDPCRRGCAGQIFPGWEHHYTCNDPSCGKPETKWEPTSGGYTFDGTACPKPCPGTFSLGGSVPDGPGTETRSYVCSASATHNFDNPGEPDTDAPWWVGQNCTNPCVGQLARDASFAPAKGIYDGWDNGLPFAAIGLALGATFLFSNATPDVWSHEIGHHRHLEHAASAPGPEPLEHDRAQNLTDPSLATASPNDKLWDRDCIMTYTDAGGPDIMAFCGKCIMNNRGWLVRAIADP